MVLESALTTDGTLVNDTQQVKSLALKISILFEATDFEGRLLQVFASLEMSFLLRVSMEKKLQGHMNLIIMEVSSRKSPRIQGLMEGRKFQQDNKEQLSLF
jgi:hypothetical protein